MCCVPSPAHAKSSLASCVTSPLRRTIRDWQLKEGQQVCVTGGAPGLGSWQLPQSLSLRLTAPSCWEVEVRGVEAGKVRKVGV